MKNIISGLFILIPYLLIFVIFGFLTTILINIIGETNAVYVMITIIILILAYCIGYCQNNKL